MVITGLSVTPVKGTRLRPVESVRLGAGGAEGDRRFFVIDERGRMVNGKQLEELCQIVASCSGRELTLELPSGEVVSAPVRLGEPLPVRFYSRMREARLVEGPFSAALTAACGQPLRLVEAVGSAVDRGAGGGVTLISRASLARLARAAGEDSVDARRFRMLVEIDGVEAHEEDGWVGRSVAIGGARVRFAGHVGRCLVTSRDPDSGRIGLSTLDVLREYRGAEKATEALPFGIYGAVSAAAEVRVGDQVALLPERRPAV